MKPAVSVGGSFLVSQRTLPQWTSLTDTFWTLMPCCLQEEFYSQIHGAFQQTTSVITLIRAKVTIMLGLRTPVSTQLTWMATDTTNFTDVLEEQTQNLDN